MQPKKIRTLLFGLIALSLLAVSCTDSTQKREGEGKDSTTTVVQDTSELAREIQRYSKLIQDSPEDYNLYYERSQLHYQNGNTEAATNDINKALVLNTDAPQLYHLRGFYAYVQNEDQIALDNFGMSAHFGSEDPETFYMMGQIEFMRENYGEANRYYDFALELDSAQPTYYFAKGFMYQQQEKFEEALEWYEKSLVVAPGFVKSIAQMHQIQMEEFGNVKAAMELNDQILAIDSLHPVGRFNQGNYYLSQAEKLTDASRAEQFDLLLKLAISEYSMALAADPMFTQAYYNRGYCFYLADDLNNAVPDLEKVLDLDPYNERAHFLLGSIQEYFGDLESALSHFEKAHQLNPGFSDAGQAVDEIRKKLGK